MTSTQRSLLKTISLACDADINNQLGDQYRENIYTDNLKDLYALCAENVIDNILIHQDNPSVVSAYADALEFIGRDTYHVGVRA